MTNSSTIRSLGHIGVLGPIAMIFFGLALAFTPLASVSSMGSVGNAGNAGKPIDTTIPGPGGTLVPPATTTAPIATDPTTTLSLPTDATTTTEAAAGGVDPGSGELPATGAGDGFSLTSAVGLVFVAIGATLLGLGRRRARM